MKFKAMTAIAALLLAPVAFAGGADDDTLVLNGDTDMTTKAAAPAHLDGALDEVISGWHFRSDETQALQMDDFENQGMIFVDQALDVWNTADGSEGKACADCHDDPESSMVGVAATYPKWNEEAGELRTVQMQVNDCRVNRMGADAWKYDAGGAVAMEALINSVSRGMPVNVAIDGPAAEYWEKGKEIYYTRYGQLELACASCHEANYGNYIRADHLSQGQINGFPAYRLKNAKLNGVHSRFKGCIRDTRAETFSAGSDEFIALELYVKSRGNGLSVEGPSVRN
ncbi:sulfur oxidation c-type cytochrome SoxA [Mameliella sediminis]|uniref:sulfur oxidation c-type cytochrome SoxA n=1 Tax=Mameliella sediminis TaxID=2836866 RepID=UPI001C46CC03|nr:sulfur oxidation c-type cytochrome SoxA [Mameliella sediminis]MBY6117017.1 sulfur oxidation c-type cytochrome SoxA [Antarctobacter heliothermus]MBY6146770.1 sulfur oxidation c-type cytochrome SoxA [Mameliella alba]MBV7396347.1 sulfur oxidation c-type cytochrome SoxA [Mameliella sediminis]MBY6160759.1 sulfur oxidation c-type cytochrome SoxA [Mameliella alba]MBY6169229.1 sulfur oxidation c-type cytochrome SoxA [Mameliella alba]